MFGINRAIRKRWRAFKAIFAAGKVPYNIDHPDIAHKIEIAFATSKATYYRFKKDVQMPAGRYKWVHARLYEFELRMKADTLRNYLNELKMCLSGKRGEIQIGEAMLAIRKMESRMDLGFDVETVKRLAAVMLFTDDEILNTYDETKGDEKIKDWDTEGALDFFWTTPIGDWLGLNDISQTALGDYIKTQTELIAALTYETPAVSSESS